MPTKSRPMVGDQHDGLPQKLTLNLNQAPNLVFSAKQSSPSSGSSRSLSGLHGIGEVSSEPEYSEQYHQICALLRKFANSGNRMDFVLHFFDWLSHSEWLKVLGDTWSTSDFVSCHRAQLKAALGTKGPRREMMTDGENAAYDALPEVITIYRGCQQTNIRGICWTLDRRLANSFTRLNRFQVDHPLLVTATVKKSNVLAVKLCRQENEIITLSAKVCRVEDAFHDQEWLDNRRASVQAALKASVERGNRRTASHLAGILP